MPHAPNAADLERPDTRRGRERRSAPRIDWPVTAKLLHKVSIGRDGLAEGQARTVNVSLSGVLLDVPETCTLGEEVALRFPLDGTDELAVVARVVRIDEASQHEGNRWLIGCEFVDVPVKQRCTLAKFLMRHRAQIIDAHTRRSAAR